MYGKWRGPEPAMPRYGRVDNWLRPGQRGPVVRRLRELYAAEVTMTDRWLGVLLDRAARPQPRERDRRGAGRRPRHPAGRARLDRQDLDRAASGADAHPAGRGRSRAGGSAGQPADWYASTHDLAPTLLSMMGVRGAEAHERRGPVAAVRRQAAAASATTPSAATATPSSSARAAGRCGRATGRRASTCSTSAAIPARARNVAHRHPKVVRHLYGIVRRRARAAGCPTTRAWTRTDNLLRA